MEITEDQLKAMFADALKELVPSLKDELKNELKPAISPENQEKTAVEKQEEVRDFIEAVVNKDHNKLVEMKAVSSVTGSFGYTIPTELAGKIMEYKDKICKMRRLAFVFPFTGPLQIPVEGTGVTSYWVDENTEITESNPTILKKDMADYYMATRVLIPRQLIRKSAFNVIEYIARLSSRSIVKTEETAFVAGDGSSKPTGLRQASVTAVPQAGTNVVYNDIINLVYTVKEQYRENCVLMTSTAGIKKLKSLNDSDGRPLLDLKARTFGDYPLIESEDIPSNLGSGGDETEIWFFDPSYYWIKDSEDMFMDTDKKISTLQTELVVAEAIDGLFTLTEAAAKLTGVK